MRSSIVISDVKFHAASPKDHGRGLVGWVSLTLDGRFLLSSIAVRRTLDGRLALAFPSRIDGAGNQRFYFRPLDSRTRKDIEAQVFQALGVQVNTVR